MHNVAVTLMQLHQNGNVGPTVPQLWKVGSTFNILCTKHCGCCINNVAAMLKWQRQIHDVCTTSTLRHQIYDVMATFLQCWIEVHLTIYHGCCNSNSDATLKSRRLIHNMLSTSVLRHCTNFASALRRTYGLFVIAW